MRATTTRAICAGALSGNDTNCMAFRLKVHYYRAFHKIENFLFARYEKCVFDSCPLIERFVSRRRRFDAFRVARFAYRFLPLLQVFLALTLV